MLLQWSSLAFLICFYCFPSVLSQRVIIVGAGAAGIAAYSRLLENNITDVLILEAEDRIGGRIYTLPFVDSLVELGAEWVHGVKGNAAYELAGKYNLLDHSYFEMKLQASSLPDYDAEFSRELQIIHDIIFTEDGNNEAEIGVSMGDYYLPKYVQMVREKYQNDSMKLRLAYAALSFFELDIANTIGSNSWYDVAANNSYRVTDGDLDLQWKSGGYKTIIEIMLHRYPHPKNSLPIFKDLINRKEVANIVWKYNEENPSGVTVTCSDGSQYTSDFVIFTPSLGVLKHQYQKMFTPELPRNKRYAIYTLGFGTVAKCIMHFPDRWWPTKGFTGFAIVWTEDTKALMRDFPLGPSEHGESWILGITGFYPIPNNPNVLIAQMSGILTTHIELIPDDIILEGLMYVFERFFAHKYPVSKPDTFLRTFWFTNRHFRGSYSYETVSSVVLSTNGQLELSQPLWNEGNKPTCLFAGEATHHTHYSTVHGAIDSGYREADRIINYIDSDSSPTYSKK